jgi:hypothetical protein
MTLDREEEDFYVLTVRATDGGTPSMNGTATIKVTILVSLLWIFSRKVELNHCFTG